MSVLRVGKLPGAVATIVAVVVMMVACGDSAADETLGDRLSGRFVDSVRERVIARDRGDLPLPGDDLFVEADLDRQRPDERFHIDLVDDLVIGQRDDDVNYIFGSLSLVWSYSLNRIAVDEDGRIYVLVRLGRGAQVRVYGPDGQFLHRFGLWGQGPGELEYPQWLMVAGEQVLIFHRRVQWSIWDAAGSHRGDRLVFPAFDRSDLLRVLPSNRVLSASGLDDGTTVMMSPVIPAAEARNPLVDVRVALSRLDGSGNETRRYFNVPEDVHPRVAVSPDGEIYASFASSGGGRYYVAAWTADGSPRWFTEIEPVEGDARWAELRLDGAGHLFVMPSYHPLARNDPRRPAHVFTTTGQLLGSGYLNRRPEKQHWQAARDGKVYGTRQDPITREWEVVRYRVEMSRDPS